MKQTWENGKKPRFEPQFGPFWPKFGSQFFFFFKNLASSVTSYYGQLTTCTVSEKTNDPILRKRSDRSALWLYWHSKSAVVEPS